MCNFRVCVFSLNMSFYSFLCELSFQVAWHSDTSSALYALVGPCTALCCTLLNISRTGPLF